MDIISGISFEIFYIFYESAPYMLLGFFFAGLIKGYTSDKFLAKHLGGKSAGSVVKASVVGVPLPLCSCGVLPTAAGLRKQGAGKGAVTSFMISTPETGVDSVAITYALIDPLMAVIRPVSAFLTAVFGGLLVNTLPEDEKGIEKPADDNEQGECSGEACSCSCDGDEEPAKSSGFRYGMGFAFGEMIDDIGHWFIIGVIVAGVISFMIPADFMQGVLNVHAQIFIMLAAGIPLYMCATASTPIAAALMLKGLSPGAALVFLLAGPATNSATLVVLGKILGKRVTAVYLAAIAISSVALGYLTNYIYDAYDFESVLNADAFSSSEVQAVHYASSIVLAIILAHSLYRKFVSR